MNDLIDRQAAIDALKICDNNEDGINCHKCPLRDERWDGAWKDDETNCYTKLMRDSAKLLELPPAQPETKLVAEITLTKDQIQPAIDEAVEKIMAEMEEPERKKGEWKIYIISMLDGEGCKCSECGFEGVPYWDYCPNCGADMREGEQERIKAKESNLTVSAGSLDIWSAHSTSGTMQSGLKRKTV